MCVDVPNDIAARSQPIVGSYKTHISYDWVDIACKSILPDMPVSETKSVKPIMRCDVRCSMLESTSVVEDKLGGMIDFALLELGNFR